MNNQIVDTMKTNITREISSNVNDSINNLITQENINKIQTDIIDPLNKLQVDVNNFIKPENIFKLLKDNISPILKNILNKISPYKIYIILFVISYVIIVLASSVVLIKSLIPLFKNIISLFIKSKKY